MKPSIEITNVRIRIRRYDHIVEFMCLCEQNQDNISSFKINTIMIQIQINFQFNPLFTSSIQGTVHGRPIVPYSKHKSFVS